MLRVGTRSSAPSDTTNVFGEVDRPPNEPYWLAPVSTSTPRSTATVPVRLRKASFWLCAATVSVPTPSFVKRPVSLPKLTPLNASERESGTLNVTLPGVMAVATVIVGRATAASEVSIVTLSPSANATATPLAFVQFAVDLSHVALSDPVQTRSPADTPAHSIAAITVNLFISRFLSVARPYYTPSETPQTSNKINNNFLNPLCHALNWHAA